MEGGATDKAHQRQRRRHKNVSTGCDSCKRRHVKCDEGKPSCERCKKAKIACAGYHPPRSWLFTIPSSSNGSTELKSTTDGEAYRTSDERTIAVHPFSTQMNAILACDSPGTVPSGPNTPLNIDNLDGFWRQVLLDVFLTKWVPASSVCDNKPQQPLPSCILMASWPKVARKLATEANDTVLEDALLSLAICLIGEQTQNPSLAREASHAYARTLTRFRERLMLLSSSESFAEQDTRLSALLATGLCCAQIELASQSILNYNRHLSGTADLLRTCASAHPANNDISAISVDHRFLWTACAMVRRRGNIYMASSRHIPDLSDADATTKATYQILGLAEQIPQLLEQCDDLFRPQLPCQMLNNFEQLKTVVAKIEQLRSTLFAREAITNCVWDRALPHTHDQVNSQDLHGQVILNGYSAAFVAHAVLCIWDLLKRARTDLGGAADGVSTKEDELRDQCHHLADEVRRSVDSLVKQRNGLMIVNPCLFFVDTAWLVYKTLSQRCIEFELETIRVWFADTSRHLKLMGLHPLRNSWNID